MVGSGHRGQRPALQEEGLEAGVGLELPPLLRRPGPRGRVEGRVCGAGCRAKGAGSGSILLREQSMPHDGRPLALGDELAAVARVAAQREV